MPNVLEKCSPYCSTKVSVPLPHHLMFGSAVSGSFLSACTRALTILHTVTQHNTASIHRERERGVGVRGRPR